MDQPAGMVAAGHPRTAEVGAEVLREGGNAVDAAIAAVLASWVCEPLLTGPGAGGYMLVAGAGEEPALLDFFVAAPGAGAGRRRARSARAATRSTSATRRRSSTAASPSCGVPGSPAGLAAASARWGSVPLADLAAPAAAMAREGVPLNGPQAYVFDLLAGIVTLDARGARASSRRSGEPLREGEPFRSPLLAETHRAPRRGGRRAVHAAATSPRAIVAHVAAHGGLHHARRPRGLRRRSRASRRAPATAGGACSRTRRRRPAACCSCSRSIASSSAPAPARPDAAALAAVMERGPGAAHARSSSPGLDEPGFLERFLGAQLGSTTHVSVLDGDGRACSVTCTNGIRAPAIVVPGTGIHLNNIMGEQDLNPLGFFQRPAGPADAVDDGADRRARRVRRGRARASAARARTASARRSCRSSSTSSTAG